LVEIKTKIDEAIAVAEKEPSSAAAPLTAASGLVVKLHNQIAGSQLSMQAKNDFQVHLLQTLWHDIEKARALALGEKFSVVVDSPVGASPDDAFMAVPGQKFQVTATFSPVTSSADADVSLQLPVGWKSEVLKMEHSGNAQIAHFSVSVPATAQATRPYWHRNDPEREALNIVDDPKFRGLPFPPPPVQASARPATGPLISADCMVRYKAASGVTERPLAVAPAFSVEAEPSGAVIPSSLHGSINVKTSARDQGSSADVQVALKLPGAWRSEPKQQQVQIVKNQSKEAVFEVFPSELKEGRAQIHAELKGGDRNYDEGYSVVTREDLGTFYYYQPALQRVSIVDVRVPKDVKVGYIIGAGDEIPTVLQQIGMNVTLIPAEKLTTEDLSKYQTIVLGIRAYDTQKDVIANNKRLLEFVEAGGRLVVQYNASTNEFNSGKFVPYPLTLSRARVSVEAAPVKILDPANRIFHSPNEITQKDFEGWVQERGLYFASQWDPKFTPLLETHDPGEGEQKGGLLVAQYGKGTYIYTGLAFFRQLPAGVPGAVRLFVNLVSAE
jgi:hypothetical protein